jgi:hypothetical protein
MNALLSELFNTISTEREREARILSFFAYANRHIIIDREEKRRELPMMLIDMVRPPTHSIKPRRV